MNNAGFKEDLQRLVNKIDLPIRVAHYPPYCSKFNPIDHRLFPHVTLRLSRRGVPETAGEAVILSPNSLVASNLNSFPACTTNVVPSLLLA